MHEKWLQIQSILKEELAPGQYRVWIAPLRPVWEDNSLLLSARSEFVAGFVRASLADALRKAVRQVLGRDCPVRVEYRPDVAPGDAFADHAFAGGDNRCSAQPVPLPSLSSGEPCPPVRSRDKGEMPSGQKSLPAPRPLSAVHLALPVSCPEKPGPAGGHAWRYSFDEFVVGPCNELAHAACRSICNGPHQADVVCLSSAPGLGKTHLLHAVGRELYASCTKTEPRVEYLTAEEFASRFYHALKTQQTDAFKARYRRADLLLLEDAHFLQGKEKMQAELLATIKAIVGNQGGKFVFTSSFSPHDFQQMDDQLQSRLCAGLLSFIERPDEDTRRRILRRKASLHQVLLPDEVEDALARHIKTDVRQIESCLQNLIFKARLYNSSITLRMAWEVIANYASHSPVLDMEAILDHVCRSFGLSREQLFSVSRKQDYVRARNLTFYLARKHTDMSLGSIGRRCGRSHSTVLKGITSLEREMSRDTPQGRQIANALDMIERHGMISPPSH